MKFLVLFLCLTLSSGFVKLSHPNEEQPRFVPPIETRRKRGAKAKLMVKSDCIFELKYLTFLTPTLLFSEKRSEHLTLLIKVAKVVFYFSKPALL